MSKYDEDDVPHILVIEVQGEDWWIKHLKDCPTETFDAGETDFTQKHEPVVYFTCRLQAVVDGNGLDDIENWKELPPGEYEIASYYQYYPGEFGGQYGEEHEIGLYLVKESE